MVALEALTSSRPMDCETSGKRKRRQEGPDEYSSETEEIRTAWSVSEQQQIDGAAISCAKLVDKTVNIDGSINLWPSEVTGDPLFFDALSTGFRFLPAALSPKSCADLLISVNELLTSRPDQFMDWETNFQAGNPLSWSKRVLLFTSNQNKAWFLENKCPDLLFFAQVG